MKAVPRFQKAVNKIALRHKVDLAQPYAYLRLHLDGHGQLVLQSAGVHRLSVTNYVPVASNYVADPQVVLLMTGLDKDELFEVESELRWIPLEINELFGGWRLAAEIDAVSHLPRLKDACLQVELARYCEKVLAVQLESRGWCELSERVDVLHGLDDLSRTGLPARSTEWV
jgi:hypothetical protein